jgi:hypothetical protein
MPEAREEKGNICTTESARLNMFGDDSVGEIIYKTFQDNYIYGLSFQLTYYLSVFFLARS